MYQQYLSIAATAWLVCAICSAFIGQQKQATGSGFLLGLLFGPAGMIAAGFVDGRERCRKCGGPQNRTDDDLPYPVCQHCGAEKSVE
jgi:hypothetical protein